MDNKKVLVRGYVKWTDENGVFHKELASEHPELLDKATEAEKLSAQEALEYHEQAEKFYADREAAAEETEILSGAEEAEEGEEEPVVQERDANDPLELLRKQTA